MAGKVVVYYVINVYDISELRHNTLVLEIKLPLNTNIDAYYAHLLVLPNANSSYRIVIVSKMEILYFDDVVLTA